jgi:hypothetical protein
MVFIDEKTIDEETHLSEQAARGSQSFEFWTSTKPMTQFVRW